MKDKIEIVGARTNNLKSLDIDLALGKATMMVGVSGSGKSSLLADTLATEANARMRRFLGVHQPHLDHEDVPAFIGAIPICIHFSQGAFRASRRTTVATSSGLLALLRYYFRRYSKPWAEEVRSFVPAASPNSYGNWIRNHYDGSLTVWVVVERWERTDGVRAVKLLRQNGLTRTTIRSETDTAARSERGREIELDRFRPLSANVKHLIEARIGEAHASDETELRSLLRKAFDIGRDVIVEFHHENGLPEDIHDERGILLDSIQHWVHPEVLLPYAPPTDALLSFNSPSNPRGGACPTCRGLGRMRTVDIRALIPKPDRSLHEGAISLWTEKNYRYVNIQHETIEGMRGLRGFDPDLAWKRLGGNARDLILLGSGREGVPDVDRRTGRKVSTPRPFPGFITAILRRLDGKGAGARALEALTSDGPCPGCRGTRWSRSARALRLGKWNLPDLLALTFDELEELSTRGGKLERELPDEGRTLASGLLAAAEAFASAGLGHLSGERGMTTLSEGESRRSRLAALLRSDGQGLALLLDEPARGLHEEDVSRLAKALIDLKHRHTLIINEHRISLASVADRVIEIGPGAGAQGGRIVSSGPPEEVFTPNWHPGFKRSKIATAKTDSWLVIKGARIHTLSGVSCRIPLGRLVCVTGVSGSGKSSFIRGVLVPALAQALPERVETEGFVWPDGRWESINGVEAVRSVLALEPRTPSAQRRSSVATLLGVAEDLRRVFGNSVEARKAGLTATDFGLNAGRGRCQTCLGLGEVQDDDRYAPCPHCGGRRFGEEALAVRVEGLNVAEVLELPITELANRSFVGSHKSLPLVDQLVALDLGYLTLGRRVDQLSGGEHQRLRIARTLTGEPEGLFLVLDEPSAGLHPKDVTRLLEVLDRVVSRGNNTIVLVEHNVDLIRASDWVIDFGPGGGPLGGRVVGQGSPGEISGLDTPTGRVLRSKKFRLSSRHSKRRGSNSKPSPVRSEKAAHSGRQWLKRLFGEEPSAEELDPVDFDGLAVTFEFDEAGVRPHEIAGLDVEIARLLLDEPDDASQEPERLAEVWADNPTAQLRIHPLLEEIRVWAGKLPISVLHSAKSRLKQMGLESNLDTRTQIEVSAIRATGKRFHPMDRSLPERVRCIRDAIAIGGGYVELWNVKAGIIDTIRKRHLDLEIPAVAPHSPTSACLVRSHSNGRCPCCNGFGSVPVFDLDLVIDNPSSDIANEQFLHPEAFKVLRGVRRSVFLPFFKRMMNEGLWPARCAFARLKLDERSTLLHGYWHRPGHGSFLKSSRANPEEVGSWVRWDGLFRTLLSELERSKSPAWIDAVRSTSTRIECPECVGAGLQSHSRAIKLGERSLFDWVGKGTIEGLVKALKKIVPVSSRSQRTLDRILHCMVPLNDVIPRAPLRAPIEDAKLLRAIFERTVHSMTRLEVVE